MALVLDLEDALYNQRIRRSGDGFHLFGKQQPANVLNRRILIIRYCNYLNLTITRHHDGPLPFKTSKVAQPHNFFELTYLDLPETCYLLPLNHRRYLQIQNFDDYVEKQFHIYFHEVLGGAREALPSGLIRSCLVHLNRSRNREILNFFPNVNFRAVIKHLYSFRTENELLACYFWRTVCESVSMKSILGSGDICAGFIRFVFLACNRAKFDFRGSLVQNTRNWNSSGCNCPFLGSFFRSQSHLLEVFLQFGFEMREYAPQVRVITCHRFFTVGLPRSYIESSEWVDTLLTNASLLRFPLLEILSVVFHCTYTCELNHDYYECECDASKVSCANLLYQSTPEPYVSASELISVLRISGVPFSIEQELLSRFMDIFNRFHMTPRSLQHLCCCVIRRCLRDNFQLPNGIQRLHLPERMDKYLRVKNYLRTN